MSRGMTSQLLGGFAYDFAEIACLGLIRLSQHSLIRYGRPIEQGHDFTVRVLEAMAAVDKQHHAFELSASPKIIVNESGPALNEVLWGLGIAVAGHVYDEKPIAHRVVVELSGAAWRI